MERIDKLRSGSSCSKFSGIMDCIENKKVTNEEKEVLLCLKQDNTVLGGRYISSYAKAALVLLGIEKQTSDEDAKYLIDSFSK